METHITIDDAPINYSNEEANAWVAGYEKAEQITSAPLLKRIEIVEEDRLRYQNIADSLKEEVKKQWPLLAKIKELEELFEKSFTLAEIRRKEIDKLILELDPLQSEIESLKKEIIRLENILTENNL
jgi:hypothetical protein